MRNTVNAVLNWKNCNSNPLHKWTGACVRYMMQNKKVNKWDEVQHEVNRSSQKYPAVPQLGFLFSNPSEEFFEMYSLYLWASSPGHISSLDTSRTQWFKREKKKKSWRNYKKNNTLNKGVYKTVSQSSVQILTLDLPLNYVRKVLFEMGVTEC